MQIDNRQFGGIDRCVSPLGVSAGDQRLEANDHCKLLLSDKPSDNFENFTPTILIEEDEAKNYYLNSQYTEWLHGSFLLLYKQASEHHREERLKERPSFAYLTELDKVRAETQVRIWYLSAILFRLYYRSSEQKASKYLEDFKKFSFAIIKEDKKCKINSVEVKIGNRQLNISHDTQVESIYSYFSLRQVIDSYFKDSNWLRLGVIRVIQVIGASVAFLAAISLSQNQLFWSLSLAQDTLQVLAPAIAVLSFLFYAPRLMLNISLLIKHTLCAQYMTHTEKGMTVSQRLGVQWQHRKFQLLNDAVWFADGLIVYVVATASALAPIAVPLNFILVGALYIFDVWNAFDDLQKARSLKNKLLGTNKNSAEAYQASFREYCQQCVSEKEFSFKITVLFLLGKLPSLLVGCLAFSMGFGILSNPFVLGVFFAATSLVLGTHLAQRAVKSGDTPLITIDEMKTSLPKNIVGQVDNPVLVSAQQQQVDLISGEVSPAVSGTLNEFDLDELTSPTLNESSPGNVDKEGRLLSPPKMKKPRPAAPSGGGVVEDFTLHPSVIDPLRPDSPGNNLTNVRDRSESEGGAVILFRPLWPAASNLFFPQPQRGISDREQEQLLENESFEYSHSVLQA